MPELPEVETIRINLETLILEKEIAKIESFTPEVLVNPKALDLSGQAIRRIFRKGKYLLLETDKASIMVHLRMTGKLLFQDNNESLENDFEKYRHMRARLIFTDGSRLLFDDIRRFGRISLFPPGEEEQDKGYAALGPDALSPDFLFADFLSKAKYRPKTKVKAFLLDQRVVAGIGNIYADEVLFRAGIHPERTLGRLSEKRLARLYEVVKEVLKEAVGLGGTSFSDYVNSFGQKGSFQLELAVYQKEGRTCIQCGTAITKTKLAGRGTHYCSKCQK